MEKNALHVDGDYIIAIRHELHMYPEIGYDNPLTLSIIRRELEQMGITYTEKYGKSSIVATINEEKSAYTIGIRADTDALLVQESNDVPYKSQIEGQMHACGHDVHTAMLLGTAKALNDMKENISCRVKLLFQCCEEGPDTGARHMVADGVMDDIDVIIGQHVNSDLAAGKAGLCPGTSMASCHPFKLIFHGVAAHITLPQTGKDALAMAVRTYCGVQQMLATEIDPFAQYICGISVLKAGQSFGTVADYAEMDGVLTTYDLGLDSYMMNRIEAIARNAAEEVGGRAEAEHEITCLIVNNNPVVSELVMDAARKVAGEENAVAVAPILGCEDFSFYLSKKPGAFFWLGTRNEKKGAVSCLHSNDFQVDEDALEIGSSVCVQFVLDNMHGIAL
ncbi:MAG: M20 family metallopeptidase [Eubacteriales bacterium]|nr:M20 family metallopeptidase [Eubacteriales bacterium]